MQIQVPAALNIDVKELPNQVILSAFQITVQISYLFKICSDKANPWVGHGWATGHGPLMTYKWPILRSKLCPISVTLQCCQAVDRKINMNKICPKIVLHIFLLFAKKWRMKRGQFLDFKNALKSKVGLKRSKCVFRKHNLLIQTTARIFPLYQSCTVNKRK